MLNLPLTKKFYSFTNNNFFVSLRKFFFKNKFITYNL